MSKRGQTYWYERCPECKGEGWEVKDVEGYYKFFNTFPKKCENCNGKGVVVASSG